MPHLVLMSCLFVAVIAAVVGLYRLITYRQRQMEDRMAMVALTQSTREFADEVVERRRLTALNTVESWLDGTRLVRSVEKRLTAAGVALKPTEFVALLGICIALGLLVGAAAFHRLWAALLLGVAGYAAPTCLIAVLRGRRKGLLERQLAATIRLIASSMRAGHGFLSGLGTAAEQMPSPMSEELDRVVLQVNRGVGTEEALRSMCRRVDSYDFDLFVNAVSVQLRGGGRLAEILDKIAATIRERMTLQRQISTASAQGKLSGTVLILMPLGIGLGLMLVNQEYAKLLTNTPLGHTLLKVAVTLQVVGVLTIRKILRIRV